jgi:hypothetical protein
MGATAVSSTSTHCRGACSGGSLCSNNAPTKRHDYALAIIELDADFRTADDGDLLAGLQDHPGFSVVFTPGNPHVVEGDKGAVAISQTP